MNKKDIKLMVENITDERMQELLSLTDSIYNILMSEKVSNRESSAVLHCVSKMVDNTAIN